MSVILHVGLGPLGQRIVSDLYRRHLGRIAPAIDVADQLRGRALPMSSPAVPTRHPIAASLDDVDCWDARVCTRPRGSGYGHDHAPHR